MDQEQDAEKEKSSIVTELNWATEYVKKITPYASELIMTSFLSFLSKGPISSHQSEGPCNFSSFL